jgi:hypothetical protein
VRGTFKEEKMKLLNAFSLSMLPPAGLAGYSEILVEEISLAKARELLVAEGMCRHGNDVNCCGDGECALANNGEEAGYTQAVEESFVGHADTAALLSRLLEAEVPMRRESVTLATGEAVIVAQYTGPRLPEGAKELPVGAEVKWLKVTMAGAPCFSCGT